MKINIKTWLELKLFLYKKLSDNVKNELNKIVVRYEK